jgi:hypothetical protein
MIENVENTNEAQKPELDMSDVSEHVCRICKKRKLNKHYTNEFNKYYCELWDVPIYDINSALCQWWHNR